MQYIHQYLTNGIALLFYKELYYTFPLTYIFKICDNSTYIKINQNLSKNYNHIYMTPRYHISSTYFK